MTRKWRTILVWASLALLLAMTGVFWILPCRMAFGPRGSYYTYTFIPDEAHYASRIQPLIEGADARNPINGIADRSLASPFFLEDALRWIVSLLRLDGILFFWIWRIIFPLLLTGGALLVAKELMSPCRPYLRLPFTLAAASAVLVCIGLEPFLQRGYAPPQGWLHRAPANIDFPLSLFLLWAYARVLKSPEPHRIGILVVAFGVIFYSRIYTALPWSVGLIAGFLYLFATRRLSGRGILTATLVSVVVLLPWIAVQIKNMPSPIYHQMLNRHFPSRPYGLHPRSMFYCVVALIALAGGRLQHGYARMLFYSFSASLFALPFISGVFFFNRELLDFDRYGVLYLLFFGCTASAILARMGSSCRGRRQLNRTFGIASLMIVAAALSGGCTAAFYVNYDFDGYPGCAYSKVIDDVPSVPAYLWMRRSTPADALVIVDDSAQYSNAQDPASDPDFGRRGPDPNDLFALVAKRRRVLTNTVLISTISDAQLHDLIRLHEGAFGLPVSEEDYRDLVTRYKPSYVFRRRRPAGMTALHPLLAGHTSVSYEDERCQILKIDQALASQPPARTESED